MREPNERIRREKTGINSTSTTIINSTQAKNNHASEPSKQSSSRSGYLFTK